MGTFLIFAVDKMRNVPIYFQSLRLASRAPSAIAASFM